MKEKGKSALLLLLWTVVLGGVYFAFSETDFGVFVSAVYAIAGTVFFLFFLLVNGGFRSLRSEEVLRTRLAAEKASERGKGKQKEAESAPCSPETRPDLFHLGSEKQEKAARLLLILAVPFLFILLADWVYLHYFFKD